MKKILCILLASLFLISAAVSCADSKTDEQTTANKSEVPTTPEESSTPEESTSVPAESTSEAESTAAETENKVSTSTEAVTEPATEPPVTNVPVTEPTETTPSALVIPENGEILEGAPYPDPLGLTAFSNVKELYEYLKNMPEKELNKILSMEQWYLWDTVQTIHVSKAELQHGIFGYFRNSILSSGAVVVPHFFGSPLELSKGKSISLEVDQSFRKTWIEFPIGDKAWIDIMKYDPELVSDAIEKGASWLIYQLNSEQTNLHNYEQFIDNMVSQGIMSVKDMTVYEKEYILGDRTVKALVYDNSKAELGAGRCVEIYFVYDDLLVHTLGQPEDIGDIFPGLTFEEVKVES